MPDIGESAFRKIKFTSQEKSSNIYIKSESWGLTGGSQITVISTNDEQEFEADSTEEFVYHSLEPFLYKAQNDTSFIYTRQKAQVPFGFKSKWTIEQIEVDNPEMMTLRADPDLMKF
jgi:hypothetical protein